MSFHCVSWRKTICLGKTKPQHQVHTICIILIGLIPVFIMSRETPTAEFWPKRTAARWWWCLDIKKNMKRCECDKGNNKNFKQTKAFVCRSSKWNSLDDRVKCQIPIWTHSPHEIKTEIQKRPANKLWKFMRLRLETNWWNFEYLISSVCDCAWIMKKRFQMILHSLLARLQGEDVNRCRPPN